MSCFSIFNSLLKSTGYKITFIRKNAYSSAALTRITPFFVRSTYTVFMCDNIFSNVNSRCGLTYGDQLIKLDLYQSASRLA